MSVQQAAYLYLTEIQNLFDFVALNKIKTLNKIDLGIYAAMYENIKGAKVDYEQE